MGGGRFMSFPLHTYKVQKSPYQIGLKLALMLGSDSALEFIHMFGRGKVVVGYKES